MLFAASPAPAVLVTTASGHSANLRVNTGSPRFASALIISGIEIYDFAATLRLFSVYAGDDRWGLSARRFATTPEQDE
jgi:hypothetical protein